MFAQREAESVGDAIRVEDARIAYGRNVVIDDLSMEVAEGAVYALLGRNGAGKSSLVRCLLGQRRLDGGVTRVLGKDPWRDRHRLMHEVGVAAEEPDIPPAMSPRSVGRFCARLHSRWDSDFYSGRLERFGVDPGAAFGRLSRGQKAQVSLAVALAPRPRLLVLDDPTLGLDPVARRAIYDELIGDLADRGVTVLLTSHDLDGVEAVATHVGFLASGRLLVNESLESLKARFRRLAAPPGHAEELRSLNLVQERELAWGVEAITDRYRAQPDGGSGDTAGQGVEVTELSLEEIFVALAEEPRQVDPVTESVGLEEAV